MHDDERADRHWEVVSRVTQLNHAARLRRKLRGRWVQDTVVGQVVESTLTRGPGRDAGRPPPR